ncbi:MAG: hypothetical protein M3Y87_12200 [Myxococcota bacterium]|nr:hypothetical protein [Myxococcota bacterium]
MHHDLRSLAVVVLALVGCTEGLDPPSIVVTPRVLAVVAEPPEVAPGVDVVVDAMISIPEDVARPLTLRWQSCLSVQDVLRASGFRGIEVPGRPDCALQTLALGEPYVVRGERTQALIEMVRSLAMLGAFDPALVEGVLATAGLAYFVEVDVLDASGEVVASAYKRVAMTTRATPTTNPPSPTFRFGETEIVLSDSERFTCVAIDGATPQVAPGAEIELAPTLPEGVEIEPWIETFPVFDYTGGLTTASENAYYTWFATAGAIGEHTTRPPERETTWRAPTAPGPQTLWLVVRDGHLGQSACRLDVIVGP